MPLSYDRRLSLAAKSPTAAAERRLVVVERMIVYFESMVDSESKRFYLLSHPQFSEAPTTDVRCELPAARHGFGMGRCQGRQDLETAF